MITQFLILMKYMLSQQENIIYILNMQYNQHFKTVRVCGDDMDVIADFHS